jgi:hypothetical protein
MFIYIGLIYLFLELYNLISYYITILIINTSCNKYTFQTNSKFTLTDEVINNIIHHDLDQQKLIEQLFFNKVQFKDITRHSLEKSLAYMLFVKSYNDLDMLELQYINKYISLIEKKNNVFFSKDKSIVQPCIEYGHSKISTWYTPIIIRLIKWMGRQATEFHMLYHGFTKYIEKGIIIWIRIDKNIKHDPLIFTHCTLGLVVYPHIIKKIMKNRILIIPETAGIIWNSNFPSDPDILATILFDKLCKLNITKYDLLVHSYGFVLGMKFFNKYSSHVNKIFAVESPILITHAFSSYEEFLDTRFHHINLKEPLNLFCKCTTNRDIVIQYHLQRCLVLHNSTLLESNCTKKVYLLLSEHDVRVPLKHYKHYINSKGLPYEIILFKNRTHGAFIYDSEFYNAVINLVNMENQIN